MHLDPETWREMPWIPATWRVLRVLLDGRTVSQSDLRRQTGLSHPIIVQQVARLRRAGLLVEDDPQSGQPGRPRIPMRFNWGYRRVLAVEVHPDGITTLAADLAGAALEAPRFSTLDDWREATVQQALQIAVRKALETPGPLWSGIGIVLPLALTPSGSALEHDGQLTPIALDAVQACLSAAWHLPVMIGDEAHALARGVCTPNSPAYARLLAVNLRQTGRARLSLFIDGRPAVDSAVPIGDATHVPVPDNALPCYCGRQGCLGTLLRAGRDDARARGQAIEALALLLAQCATLVHPTLIVLQHDDQWTDNETARLEEVLGSRTLPAIGKVLQCEVRPNRPHECLLGAARSVAQHVLDLRTGLLPVWAASGEDTIQPLEVCES
jgi:hypothetical protein